MEIIKQLQKGQIQIDMPAGQESVRTLITRALNAFVSTLYEEIFTNNLDRRKYDLLEANTIYVNFITNMSDQYSWSFIFANSSTPGIFYKQDLVSDFNLIKFMVQIELSFANVLYGVNFTNEDLFPIPNLDLMKDRVSQYLNGR